MQKRMADNSKDNPDAYCLPMGIMQMTAHPYPKKIIQTPTEVVIIYEASGMSLVHAVPLPPVVPHSIWYFFAYQSITAI